MSDEETSTDQNVGYQWWNDEFSYLLIDKDDGENASLFITNGAEADLDGPWAKVADFGAPASVSISFISSLMMFDETTQIHVVTQSATEQPV